MVKVDIKLTDSDMTTLDMLKDRNQSFNKTIYYNDRICVITVSPKGITNENYEYVERFFEVKFYLGSHPDEPLIKYSAKTTYTLVYTQILNVLLGDHILVNTADGERILINITA